jgi:hypothetical protein
LAKESLPVYEGQRADHPISLFQCLKIEHFAGAPDASDGSPVTRQSSICVHGGKIQAMGNHDESIPSQATPVNLPD